ncbi:MAG: hypothetical protein ACH350_08730 [Parachlamydiaceae bacterium]
MSKHDRHQNEELDEEFIEEPERSPPIIYEGMYQESIPIGFDTVTIHLDGRMRSSLDWKIACRQASQAIQKGYNLIWDIELGLFSDLTQPLGHQGQFLSLALALEHFRDTVWKEFKFFTIGLILFRGQADFSQELQWNQDLEDNLRKWFEELNVPHFANLNLAQIKQDDEGCQLARLYCRDVAVEYLTLLASRLPDSLPVYLFLDVTHFPSSLLMEMQLLNSERFENLKLGFRGGRLPFNGIGWGNPTSYGYSGHAFSSLPEFQKILVGFCVPPIQFYRSLHYDGFEEGVRRLQERSIPFKLIAESQLTSQWDGLDALFFCPNGLSQQGKRKLQGFCAAGGTAVSMGDLIGLSHEMSLDEWLTSHQF